MPHNISLASRGGEKTGENIWNSPPRRAVVRQANHGSPSVSKIAEADSTSVFHGIFPAPAWLGFVLGQVWKENPVLGACRRITTAYLRRS
jgi:hypothetical protein